MSDQPSTSTTRIEPSTGWLPLDLTELWRYRDLLYLLALRSVKLRYRQTILGLVWVVLQPLLPAIIVAVIFGRMAHLPSEGHNYLLFAYSGLLAWNIFSQMLQRGGNILVTEHHLLRKVYFPRMLLPLSSGFGVLLDFGVGLIFMVVLMFVLGDPPTVNFLLIPVFAGLTLLFSAAVTLVVSALNVYYRDVTHALPFVVRTLMWATPVVYSAALVPERWHMIYALNPMVGLIDAFRWAILGHQTFPWASFGVSVGVGFVGFWIGASIFRRLERNFADII